MSCRSTRGGSVSTRLARLYSGLSDSRIQGLFHSLKREGTGLPAPDDEEMKIWQGRQRALIDNSDMSDRARARAEADLFRAGSEQPDGATFHAWRSVELRARQESVIDSISTAIDLDPPGAHADRYAWTDDGRLANVWYASYGSNMSRARFLTYIQGGKPPGSTSVHVGARDSTEPTGDMPIRFFGRMHFAYSSGRWGGGGIAFVDLDTSGHALGRAFRITGEQFDDVVAQENGQKPGVFTPVPVRKVLDDGRAEIGAIGPYRNIIHIGDYDGAPVLTFTASFTANESLKAQYDVSGPPDKPEIPMHAANEPSANYLRMIGSGLQETFNLTDRQQADYLRGSGGADTWNRRDLLHALRTPPTQPKPPTRPTTSNWSFGSGGSSPSESGRLDDVWVESSLERKLATGDERGAVQGILPLKPRGTRKACLICSSTQHDLHGCPQLKPQRKTGKKKPGKPSGTPSKPKSKKPR